jgi:hypothetical protein
VTQPALLNQRDAEEYLGMGQRWLDDAPLPWVDLRKPGASKPVKRWRVVDLDAAIEERLVQPGESSPW